MRKTLYALYGLILARMPACRPFFSGQGKNRGAGIIAVITFLLMAFAGMIPRAADAAAAVSLISEANTTTTVQLNSPPDSIADFYVFNGSVRKSGGTNSFSDVSTDGMISSLAYSPVSVAWTQGTPIASSSGWSDYDAAELGQFYNATYAQFTLTMPAASGTLEFWLRPNGDTGDIFYDVTVGGVTHSYEDTSGDNDLQHFTYSISGASVGEEITIKVHNVSGSNSLYNVGFMAAQLAASTTPPCTSTTSSTTTTSITPTTSTTTSSTTTSSTTTSISTTTTSSTTSSTTTSTSTTTTSSTTSSTTTSASTTTTVSGSAHGQVTAPLDVDGDGLLDGGTDALLIRRYLYGFEGSMLTDAAVGEDCTRCTASAIQVYLATLTYHRFSNGLGMTFNLIPAGTFVMGTPAYEPVRPDSETHQLVTLTQAFYMQVTEVTQGQWKAVMGTNPSYFSGCGDNCPVETVSWDDVQEFITKMNQRGEGTYRLPTEAEWEYGARAGSTTAFANGGITLTECGLDPNLDAIGWYCGNSHVIYSGCDDLTSNGGPLCAGTHPVALKQANAYGLYDMAGNVREWCQDWYEFYYPAGPLTDPTGPSTGSYRVFRGGSWDWYASNCRSALRGFSLIDHRGDNLGFRLVWSPGQQR